MRAYIYLYVTITHQCSAVYTGDGSIDGWWWCCWNEPECVVVALVTIYGHCVLFAYLKTYLKISRGCWLVEAAE